MAQVASGGSLCVSVLTRNAKEAGAFVSAAHLRSSSEDRIKH